MDASSDTSSEGSYALGSMVIRTGEEIRSSLAPFQVLPNYITAYPEVVIEALGNLYLEYNQAFRPLVAANREWETDYRYCMPDGNPTNWAVQIDMVGLSEECLQHATKMSERAVRETLRHKIFEFENSLAMYQLLERIYVREDEESFFKPRFRAALSALRRKFGKPIALLAVTDQKYQAMRESEFGKRSDEPLSDTEVLDLSGFDRFFGPDEFRDHLVANGGQCNYMLFARTSDPVAKLKRPDTPIDHPLLGNPEMRRIIKAHSLTFNVDAPEWRIGDVRRINDTKRYMPSMDMAFPIGSEMDMLSPEFVAHLSRSKAHQAEFSGIRLAPNFADYLRKQHLDPEAVATGKIILRCKPIQGTYGCYGHLVGAVTEGQFRGELRRNLRMRGGYIVQPEMQTPRLTDTDGMKYTYIDRNFFAIVNGRPAFLGGFRSLMPLEANEAQKGRIHGNDSTVWAEIVS